MNVEVQKYEQDGIFIAHIQVPKSHTVTATTDGLILRRKLKHDGTPESVPFYPHEFNQRQSSLGLVDPSSAPILSFTVEALNALERQRIREAIRRYGGENSLLDLDDSEFDGALGFMDKMNNVIAQVPFKIVATAIDKRILKNRYNNPDNPYELALEFCLERTHYFLKNMRQTDKLTHLVVESRGAKEDKDLGCIW